MSVACIACAFAAIFRQVDATLSRLITFVWPGPLCKDRPLDVEGAPLRVFSRAKPLPYRERPSIHMCMLLLLLCNLVGAAEAQTSLVPAHAACLRSPEPSPLHACPATQTSVAATVTCPAVTRWGEALHPSPCQSLTPVASMERPDTLQPCQPLCSPSLRPSCRGTESANSARGLP